MPQSSPAGKLLLSSATSTERWTAAFSAGQGTTKNSNGGQHFRGLMWDESRVSPGETVDNEGQPNVNAAFGRNFGVGYRADDGGGSSYPYKGYSGSIDGSPQNSDCCSWGISKSDNKYIRDKGSLWDQCSSSPYHTGRVAYF